MSLIKSISGIRGTIGGKSGENLTPVDIIRFTSAYGQLIKSQGNDSKKIVIGRDARVSGDIVRNLVAGTLQASGFDVICLGLATTPTTAIAVKEEKAAGGIIITASHNPKEWNALKLLNSNGEFLSREDGEKILELAETENFLYADINELGAFNQIQNYEDIHIKNILDLELVNPPKIKNMNFSVVIDCVNSVGGIAIPKLLSRLGVSNVTELFCTPNGDFPHDPEPLPENLKDIAKLIKQKKADVGFVVDPDVDRLAIVCEDGTMFGEEYTLVAIADYVLSKNPGNTVSNLSSTQALKDITEQYGQKHFSSAVGEVNVVEQMKNTGAVIGGEGNGGVIYPKSHYCRDALVGIALFLSFLAEKKIKVSDLKKSYPFYHISKNKIKVNPELNVEKILEFIINKYSSYPKNTTDGLKIEFPESGEWVQLRKSNTEPIIRIYAESDSVQKASELANKIMDEIRNYMK